MYLLMNVQVKPLPGCLSSRCKTKCKHGFPKKINLKCKVICQGNYRRFNVRISGRRNSLGCIMGRRTLEYQSGTMAAMALVFGSNSHTMPNYRLPLNEETHDPECNASCLDAFMPASAQTEEQKRRERKLCKIA